MFCLFHGALYNVTLEILRRNLVILDGHVLNVKLVVQTLLDLFHVAA